MLKRPCLSLLLAGLIPAAFAGDYGFDVVMPPAEYGTQLTAAGLDEAQGTWMRVRGLVDPAGEKPGDLRTMAADRAGLQALRGRGIKTAVLLRWGSDSWSQGVRTGGGQRFPLDLREAYERGRRLGAAYGDLVDVWEIENEPDIDFVTENPETYAAFQKAMYLGLRAGGAARMTNDQCPMTNGRDAEAPFSTSNVQRSTSNIHRDELGGGKPEGGNLKPENGTPESSGLPCSSGTSGIKSRVSGFNESSSSGWRDRKRDRVLLSGRPFEKPEAGNLKPEGSEFGSSGNSGLKSQVSGLSVFPLVIMAPLALPPGPYFERLWANGLASYTDGLNFHYYGYAEDFTGVYRQFENAVGKCLKPEGGDLKPENGTSEFSSFPCRSGNSGLRFQVSAFKRLPVFLTEYGYGLLDAESRDTVEGRVRQWRWFASVAKQIHTLRPEGPMAFLLNPYYEANLNEFGLTTVKQLKFEGGDGKPETGNLKPENGTPESETSGLRSQASGLPFEKSEASLSFTASDFDQRKRHPWMALIGKKLGENYATPALAYLWDYAARHPYQPRPWRVQAEMPSPVIIDFIADADLVQMKSSGGYRATGKVASSEQRVASMSGAAGGEGKPETGNLKRGEKLEGGNLKPEGSESGNSGLKSQVSGLRRTGLGRVVLYNFSTVPVAGTVTINGDGLGTSFSEQHVTLAAGERRELPVELTVQAQRFVASECRMTFAPDDRAIARGVFSTRFFPAKDEMTVTQLEGFDFSEEATRARQAMLLKRPLAVGEAPLKAQGRWLVSEGVRVEEIGGVWRFYIDHLPGASLRPAAVELPLPEGFAVESGTMVLLERRRLADAVVTAIQGEVATAPMKPRAGVAGDMMDVYFRTENGNLFQTWPRLRVGENWTTYAESTENFTMGFFGRAALPWRFRENRPAALVFFLRPSRLPSIFEVRDAQIVRVEREAP